jgi:SAM-dependent methyltransferase
MLKPLISSMKWLFNVGLRQMGPPNHQSRKDQRRCLVFFFYLRKTIDQQINQYCSEYYDHKHPKHYLWREHSRYIYDNVQPGERVLDIGCGASEYPQWLSEKVQNVTCVDNRLIRVEQARKNNQKSNVFYEQMDVTTDLPCGRFDVAVCSHVLEHLDDPVLFLQKLAEKVPRIVVKVPLDDSDWMKLVKKDLGIFWMDDTDHRREYSMDLLRGHLEGAGWHIDEMIRGYDLRAIATSKLIQSDSTSVVSRERV